MPYNNDPICLDGRAASKILPHFPSPLQRGNLVSLGNHGGFSGAWLWRVESPAGAFCLRAWPANVTASRLDEIHRLMILARSQGLPFVPTVIPTSTGLTQIEHADRLWDLTEWLPGRADYHEHPSPARLAAACAALAQLHRAWQSSGTTIHRGSCPAVERRLEAVRSWKHLLHSGWVPRFLADDTEPVSRIARRAWDVLPRWVERVRRSLESCADPPRVLQSCLCDPWHDNLLFEGDRLTGLVDYGSIKRDQVAVDLARLLGSLVEDDVDGWRNGLEAYRRVKPLSQHEEKLAQLLDWTGTVMGVVQWLRWFYEERRAFADHAKAAARLEALVRRIERWESGLTG